MQNELLRSGRRSSRREGVPGSKTPGGHLEQPRDIVARMEREPALPQGDEERFNGYGVMAAPFSTGDVLAMRRFAASSLGPGYTTVWHMSPGGDWTFWSDRDPMQACPRYFGSAITRSVRAPIDLVWDGPQSFVVSVDDARLRWSVELEATVATRLLNSLGRGLTDRLWKSPRMLSTMGWLAGDLLRAGRLGLTGLAPNGQRFVANPMQVWMIARSRATLGGRTMDELAPLAEQVRLGDFWIPQRGLFAIGRAFFEAADPQRHTLVVDNRSVA